MKNSCTQAPVALITGSARRIGASIAKYLHQAGFRVIVHYNHSKKEAMSLVDELNRLRTQSAYGIRAELDHVSSCTNLIKQAVKWAGQLDVLVNNASIFKSTDMQNPAQSDWEALFNINTRAPFWLSQQAFGYLKQQHGCIINISDIHAEKPLKHYAIYCQSKAALNMQTFSLAKEFAPDVRVNAIAPGAIMWPEESNALSDDQKQQIIDKTLLKQHGSPESIAKMCLAIIENPFVTGIITPIDGGRRIS